VREQSHNPKISVSIIVQNFKLNLNQEAEIDLLFMFKTQYNREMMKTKRLESKKVGIQNLFIKILIIVNLMMILIKLQASSNIWILVIIILVNVFVLNAHVEDIYANFMQLNLIYLRIQFIKKIILRKIQSKIKLILVDSMTDSKDLIWKLTLFI
jgi:hypothetical protein